jgi:hypothetical protein
LSSHRMCRNIGAPIGRTFFGDGPAIGLASDPRVKAEQQKS